MPPEPGRKQASKYVRSDNTCPNPKLVISVFLFIIMTFTLGTAWILSFSPRETLHRLASQDYEMYEPMNPNLHWRKLALAETPELTEARKILDRAFSGYLVCKDAD